MKHNKDNPIFLHSLWRSGSTYFFEKFRRSEADYFVYQEPVHENMLAATADRERLRMYSEGAAGLLRHPELSDFYYAEAYQTYDQWHDTIHKSFIYDDYFSDLPGGALGKFLTALIDAAPRTAVIQECRTSGRIGMIKESLGGRHIYIWRNPRDQWWSIKINSYFDAGLQMILNAEPHPASVAAFRGQIGFAPFHSESISDEFMHFSSHPLSAENGYACFFLIWCLAWLEGHEHADLLINVDRLSGSEEYRRSVEDSLAKLGIDAVGFDDCNMPCAPYTAKDIGFFESIEQEVFALLASHDVAIDDILGLREAHRRFSPVTQPVSAEDVNAADALEALERARAIALRFENMHAHVIAFRNDALNQLNQQRLENTQQEHAARTQADAAQEAIERLRREFTDTEQAMALQLAANERSIQEHAERLEQAHEQISIQTNLLHQRENEILERAEIWHAAENRLQDESAALKEQIANLVAQRTLLTEQHEQLQSRFRRLELAVNGLVGRIQIFAKEAARLRASPLSRLLTKMGLLPCSAIAEGAEAPDSDVISHALSAVSAETCSKRPIPIHHVDQLLSLNGSAFIDALYHAFLGRMAEPEGREYYMQRLRAGDGKEELIVTMGFSAEARAAGLVLPGFDEMALRVRSRRRLSFLSGRFDRLLNRVEHMIGEHQKLTDEKLDWLSKSPKKMNDPASSSDEVASSSGAADEIQPST
jgi:hypothetical protein